MTADNPKPKQPSYQGDTESNAQQRYADRHNQAAAYVPTPKQPAMNTQGDAVRKQITKCFYDELMSDASENEDDIELFDTKQVIDRLQALLTAQIKAFAETLTRQQVPMRNLTVPEGVEGAYVGGVPGEAITALLAEWGVVL